MLINSVKGAVKVSAENSDDGKDSEKNDSNSVEEGSENNPEVKVQWKTVGGGGNKQKELGKGFFTPKAYESDDVDSEQVKNYILNIVKCLT